jgi:protein TonB
MKPLVAAAAYTGQFAFSLSTVTARPVSSRRHLAIAGSVVLFHVAALWALQTGLIRRAVEIIVPVEMLSQLIEPPTPKVEPPPPAPRPPEPVKQPVVKKTAPRPPPAPRPVAIADPTPAPNAPTGVLEPQPPAPPIAAPVAPAEAPPAPPAPATPARVELPSSNADYLQNPKPAYPPISKRLGEQGKVIVRVLIGTDGTAQNAEIRQSSGYERLDQAALATVLKWRYVPGKRGGVPEAMWFNVPINFVLE